MKRSSLTFRFLLIPTLLGALLLGSACARDEQPQTSVEAVAPVEPGVGAATTPAAPAANGSQGGSRPATQAARQGPAEPDGHLAFVHVLKLADEIGVRVSGTPEEHAAAAYIADTLRSYGYDVEQQRFSVTAFVSRKVSLQMETPQQRAFEAQALRNSRGGSATGEVVFAGIGRPEEFSERVRGRIALVQRGELTFQQKAANAAAAGATALVVFNNADEMLFGDLTGNAPDIPVLGISGVDGRLLRDRALAGGTRLSLSFDGGRETSESINVIARTPGTACRVMLGGHYDSVPGAPGASDNASGTAAVIEMARVQALRNNPEHACFAAFGSEETGLNGSRHFVRSMRDEDRRALRFMLNFDMVAFGTEWLLIGTPALQEQGRAVMESLGIGTRFIVPLGFSSDHQAFIDGGVPALFLHRANDPLLHTPEDVVGRISVDQLAESMRIGLAFLAGLNPA